MVYFDGWAGHCVDGVGAAGFPVSSAGDVEACVFLVVEVDFGFAEDFGGFDFLLCHWLSVCRCCRVIKVSMWAMFFT